MLKIRCIFISDKPTNEKQDNFLNYFQGNRAGPGFFKPEKAAFRRQNGLLSSLP
jgi:hypothetical protein